MTIRIPVRSLAAMLVALSIVAGLAASCGGETKTTEILGTATPTGPNVEILSSQSIQDVLGRLVFVGEIVNNGDEDAAGIQVIVTLTDVEGNVVTSGGESARALTVLPEGLKMPFKIQFFGSVESWDEEKFEVQFRPARADDRVLSYTDFEVSDVSVEPREAGGLLVRGQLTNLGSETVIGVVVAFAGRDDAGNVAVVAYGFADRDMIAPGESSSFEIDVFDTDVVPASDEFFVEGTVE